MRIIRKKETVLKSKLLILLPFLILSGCAKEEAPDIVVSSFVSYDAIKSITGDTIKVKNIMPWGSELHGFEPTPQDIVNINQAKLFVYTSPELDTWVKGLVANDNIFDMSANFHNEHIEEETSEEPTDHDHDHGVHYFTNPVYYVEILDNLLVKLNNLFPANSTYFTEMHAKYTASINETINTLQTFLSPLTSPTIYFAGHNALDAFADEFGITIRSLSESYKPDVDFISPTIAAFIEEMKANNIKHLFTEELVEPRMANLIKNEMAKGGYPITIYELHGYHNITNTQAKEGVTYDQIFKTNVTYLSKALGN